MQKIVIAGGATRFTAPATENVTGYEAGTAVGYLSSSLTTAGHVGTQPRPSDIIPHAYPQRGSDTLRHANSLYVTLVELMEARLGRIVSRDLYSPGDFMYTNTEHALALDFALLRKYLATTDLANQFHRIIESTLASGIQDHGNPMSARTIETLANKIADRYFYNDQWLENITPDLISIVTGHECSSPAGPTQAELRSTLSLLLGHDLQSLHWDLLNLSGNTHGLEIDQIDEERIQMDAFFQHRYGCLTMADVGLVLSIEDRMPLKPGMVAVKRIFDTVLTVALLVVISPLLLLIIFILALQDGPIFYSHRRIGRNGRIFHCQKFSTMVPNAERILADLLARDPEARAEWQQFEKLRNDPRITGIGAFLRKTSLDELPQLFNVLLGDMSLVGPRPMAVHERDRWNGSYRSYTSLRPGVTGPWQIYHRNYSDYQTRIESMKSYIQHWSLFSDFKYLVMTLTVPFKSAGS